MDTVQAEKVVKALGDNPTLKNFIEQFGSFAQGPDGVAKIRNLVLQLAASGRLIERCNNKVSVNKLIVKVQDEMNRLVKEKLYKQKPFPAISKEEIPFDIPDHWMWVRLGNIGLGATGKTPSTKKSEFYGGNIPFIGPGQITPSGKILSADKYLTELGKKESVDALPSDILMVCIGGSIGKTALVSECTTFNQQINRIRPLFMISAFINYLLSAPYFLESVLSASTGSATPIINRMKWEALLLPLAPLEEQKRIVAKVDELMTLCDQLEAQQQQQANTLLKANAAAIHALLSAESSQSTKHKEGKQKNFKAAWERIANNFHTLYGNTLPMPPGAGRQKKYFVGLENVKQLRQMILNLAVIGHLTSKDKSDTPFSLYLDKLNTYCEKNNITRVQMRAGHLEEVDDINFSLPEGWEYASLTQVAYFLGGGTPSKNISSFWGGNIPWVSPKDMKTDNIVDSELKITEIGLNSSAVKLIPVNSLLVVARSGILKRTLPVATNTIECTLNQDMKAIVPIKPELQPYIKLLLQGFTPFILKNLVKGGMTVQSLRYKEFEAFKFPFPPLEEQNRIVAKVDQLMVLCDQLEQQITTAYGDAENLINATIRSLVA